MSGAIIKTKRYIKSRGVRERYNNITGMTLYRWGNDPDLGFPQPVVINGIRFFDVEELDAFDATRRRDANEPVFRPRAEPMGPVRDGDAGELSEKHKGRHA